MTNINAVLFNAVTDPFRSVCPNMLAYSFTSLDFYASGFNAFVNCVFYQTPNKIAFFQNDFIFLFADFIFRLSVFVSSFL